MLRKKRKKFLMPRIRIRGIRARRLRLLPPPKNLPSAVLPPSGESVRNRKARVRGMLRRKTIGVRAPASKRPHGRRLPHKLVKFGLFLRQYPRRRPRRRQIREQLRNRRRRSIQGECGARRQTEPPRQGNGRARGARDGRRGLEGGISQTAQELGRRLF